MEKKSLYHPVRIGSLELGGNIFLAPVAGYSDRAFRSICFECGADFAYTEMVSAEALTRNNKKTEILMRRAPNEKAYAVQIFGGTPDVMADAAKIVIEKTDAECIDINCGCPVPKIVKTGAGSALTRDPDRLYSVVRAVVGSVSESARAAVPVTVKIRSGWDSESITWREAAEAALSAGAAAITIHGRTKAQGYEGKADWGILAELKKLVDGKTGGTVPVFARGAMGNPFIFTRTKHLLVDGTDIDVPVEERIRAGFRELSLLVEDIGEEAACRESRKRFCAYTKGIDGGAALRKQIVASSTVEEYRAVFGKYL